MAPDNDHFASRAQKRLEEIQSIKQLNLIDLLESRGFRGKLSGRNGAKFFDLPNVDGETLVFYASWSQAWLCKFKEPRPGAKGYGNIVTRSVIDLFEVMYWPGSDPEDSYSEAIRELRATLVKNQPTPLKATTETGAATCGDEKCGDEADANLKTDSTAQKPISSVPEGEAMEKEEARAKTARMKARYDLFVRRTADFDPHEVPPEDLARAKKAVKDADTTFETGNEARLNLLLAVAEMVLGVSPATISKAQG